MLEHIASALKQLANLVNYLPTSREWRQEHGNKRMPTRGLATKGWPLRMALIFVSLLRFQFDLSTERVGILFLVMAACYALASPVWGWLADRIVS